MSFKRDDLQQNGPVCENQSLVGLVGFGENSLKLNGNPLYLLLRKTVALGEGKHLLLCVGSVAYNYRDPHSATAMESKGPEFQNYIWMWYGHQFQQCKCQLDHDIHVIKVC